MFVASHAIAEDLDLIAEMATGFARSRDIEATLRLGLARIVERVGAEAASLFLLDDDTGELVCHACVGPTDVAGLRLPPGAGIVGRTVAENASQMVEDTRADPDFAAVIDRSTGFTTRSILCAPLAVREQRFGAIELFNKQAARSFSGSDRQLLEVLAASAALALYNARLAAAMAEQEALRHELALAADIQRAMLPKPQGPASAVHGMNLPARGVSGDFYEILPLADGRIAFAVADVSGKGMNAALLMAKTASLFRCLAKRLDGPGTVLAAIDAELHETGHAGMFVTMVAGTYDPASGRVVLANAGHEPPLVLRGGAFEAIADGMPPLGVLPGIFDAGCPESTVDLAGSILYLFTDGLTEARVPGGGMLGPGGVERLLLAHAGLPPADRLAAVVAALDQSAGLRDDVTMLVVEGLVVEEGR